MGLSPKIILLALGVQGAFALETYTGLSAGAPLFLSARGGVLIPGLSSCGWFGHCKGYDLSGEVGLGGARAALGWHRRALGGGVGYGSEVAWMTTWNFMDLSRPSQSFGVEGVLSLFWLHARLGVYLPTSGPLRGYLQSRTALGIGF